MDDKEKRQRAARRRDKRDESRADRQNQREAKARPRHQQKRKAITALESIGFLIIIAGVLVLANVASSFVFGRIDLTANKIHSLSEGSERLVGSLEDQMTITAYFTENLPEPWNALEQYTRHLLDEYVAASNGKLVVRYVHPDTQEEREQAQEDGVTAVPHTVMGQGSVNVQEGYHGLVIRYLDRHETVAVIQEPRGLEYAISSAIRELVRDPIKVGIVSGHGSPELTDMSNFQAAMSQYEISAVSVSEEIDVNETPALIIAGPTERFTDEELRRINQYVMNGGSLGIFGGAMNIEQSQMGLTGRPADTGLNELLRPWGMTLEEGVVADMSCGQVQYPHPVLRIPLPTYFPPIPILAVPEEAQDHPVTFRLSSVPLVFASPIETNAAFERLNGRILARSGEGRSWLLTGDSINLTPRDQNEWEPQARGPYNMLAAVQGTLPSAFTTSGDSNIEAPARSRRPVQVFVTGSGWLLRNDVFPDQQRTQGGGQFGGAMVLTLNAIDWLTQDQDLIAVRAKNVEDPQIDMPRTMSRPSEEAQAQAERVRAGEVENEEELEQIQENIRAYVRQYNEAEEAWKTEQSLYRWGITLGIPFLVIIAGILRWVMRRNKRANLDALRAKLIRERVAQARSARERS
jgi:gliding-associated putative ABC transporter substrate-binding component GldG